MRVDRRRPWWPRRGAAAVELALTAPVLFLLICGHLEVTRLGMVAQMMTNAAREACRVAVINGSTPDDVRDRVADALAGTGIDVATQGTITITPENIQATEIGDSITVELTIPYSTVSWLPTLGLLGNPTIRASATLSSERPSAAP